MKEKNTKEKTLSRIGMVEENYIFNRNHNRTHTPGCRAISMMNRDKNEIPTDEIQGPHCKWCLGQGYTSRTPKKQSLNSHIGEEICTDPTIRDIFKKSGCINCHSHLGDTRMYPSTDGIKVEGRPGKWWVYFSCFECRYETALWKAINQNKSQTPEHNHEPVKVIN